MGLLSNLKSFLGYKGTGTAPATRVDPMMQKLGSTHRPQAPIPEPTRRGRPSTEEKVPSMYRGTATAVKFLPFLAPEDGGDTEETRRAMRLMIRDPYVKAAWLSNLLTVAGQDFQLQPFDKSNKECQEQADFCHDQLENAEGGMVQVAISILNPLGPDGYTVAEKVLQPIIEGKHHGKVGLRALKSKHPDRVRLTGDDFQNVTGLTVKSTNEQYPISDFVYTRYLPLHDEPEGMAPWRAAYSAYWMLDTVRKLRIIHHEKKIGGMLVGEYVDPADQSTLEAALSKASSATWMTIPQGTRIQALAISTASETEYKSFVEDLRNDIVTGITFAALQIVQGTVPDARGDSKVQKSISDLAPWYLTNLLQESINRQVIKDLIDYNFAAPAGGGYPRITFGAVSNAELVQLADLVARAQQLGLKPSRKYYAEALSIQEADPNDPDDALLPAGQQMPGGGMPGMESLLGGGQPSSPGSPFEGFPPDPGGGGDPLAQGGQPAGFFYEAPYAGQDFDGFGWEEWQQIPGGKWKSPGGRVLRDQTYQAMKRKGGSDAPKEVVTARQPAAEPAQSQEERTPTPPAAQGKDIYVYARSHRGQFVALAGPFKDHHDAEQGYSAAMQRLRAEKGDHYVSEVAGASYSAQEPGSPPPKRMVYPGQPMVFPGAPAGGWARSPVSDSLGGAVPPPAKKPRRTVSEEQKLWNLHSRRLSTAQTTGDKARVAREALAEFEKRDLYPDDWSKYQRAIDDHSFGKSSTTTSGLGFDITPQQREAINRHAATAHQPDFAALKKAVDQGATSSRKTKWNYDFAKAKESMSAAGKKIDEYARVAKPEDLLATAKSVTGTEAKNPVDAVKQLKLWVGETIDLLTRGETDVTKLSEGKAGFVLRLAQANYLVHQLRGSHGR